MWLPDGQVPMHPGCFLLLLLQGEVRREVWQAAKPGLMCHLGVQRPQPMETGETGEPPKAEQNACLFRLRMPPIDQDRWQGCGTGTETDQRTFSKAKMNDVMM
jgi:hypothetical protein